MQTDKKNQHYIPKFYLRNFSYQKNNKQIGLFNIENELFIERAKLKTQGSKNFFYGVDGVIEDSLADIEGHLSQTLKSIIVTNILPQRLSNEHFDLLTFIALTDMRNPVRIEGVKSMLVEMTNRLKELDPNVQAEKFVPELSHDELIRLSLGSTLGISEMIADLGYKLFFNDTNSPFITSDYPVIKYNQFLESKKWPGSKTGYGATGLQIIFPLNSKVALILFDPNIYKVGYKKQNIHTITSSADIDKINILQFINCFDTIFFDESANENYIRNLYKQSKQFERANIARSQLSNLIENGTDNEQMKNSEQKNLLILNATDCNVGLNISGLKIHSNGKNHKLNPSMAQLRPHANNIRKNRREQ